MGHGYSCNMVQLLASQMPILEEIRKLDLEVLERKFGVQLTNL